MKTIVKLEKFKVSKILKDGHQTICTFLVVNSCCNRSNNLCVVAIHNTEPIPEIPARTICREGKSQPCEKEPNCERCWFHEHISAIPAMVSGIFSVSLREREGKLPVVHLNPSNEKVNALFVNLEDGALHDQSSYMLEEGEGIYFENTIRSGGGSTQNTLLWGFVNFGSIITHFHDSYKGRQGNSVTILKVTSEGLKEVPVALADGLKMQDLIEGGE